MVSKEVILRKLEQLEDVEIQILKYIINEARPVSRKDIYIFLYERLGYLVGEKNLTTDYADHYTKLKDVGLISVEILDTDKEEWEVPSPLSWVILRPERIVIQQNYLTQLQKILFKGSDLCFVLMPFDETFIAAWNYIKSINLEGIIVKRADDISSAGVIIEQVFEAIDDARVVIADCTGLNPNVMYELGYAHAKNKDTIIITREEPEVLPFDIRHRRIIRYYPFGFAYLKKELTKAISETIIE